jgi:hypothetical protein
MITGFSACDAQIGKDIYAQYTCNNKGSLSLGPFHFFSMISTVMNFCIITTSIDSNSWEEE